MTRKTVLLLFGGESSEHEVSIIGARNVYAALNQEKYQVALGYITRDGRWFLVDGIDERDERRMLSPLLGTKAFGVSDGTEMSVDVIFPILHGANGEDGTVQGLAKLTHIPIVGPSLLGAAITCDKDVTKSLLHQFALPVAAWIVWHTHEKQPEFEMLDDMFDHEFFVKPARAGSSFGVSKVTDKKAYDEALQLAAQYDNKVMIEPSIKGIEVQVAIYGNKDPQVSDICEIESTADFHDFEDKYSDTSTVGFHIPARLSPDQTDRIKQQALSAYLATECNGMARVDFFVVNEDTEYINEINSIPGFTNVSVFPMLWQKAGKEYAELIDELIELELEVYVND